VSPAYGDKRFQSRATPAGAGSEASVLVVAHRTADSPELVHVMRERAAEGAAAFTLLVPASGHGVVFGSDPQAATLEAGRRIRDGLRVMRRAGLTVEGRLGDPDPMAAVHDAVNFGTFDEVIVSTLPAGFSRWLGVDLPRRVAWATGLEVRQVTASGR